MAKRSCGSLKAGESVVFKLYSDIYNKKIPMDGTVIYVNTDRKVVWVSYLEGYKDRSDAIPFEDMLAVHNPNGPMMHFDNIYGKSDILFY